MSEVRVANNSAHANYSAFVGFCPGMCYFRGLSGTDRSFRPALQPRPHVSRTTEVVSLYSRCATVIGRLGGQRAQTADCSAFALIVIPAAVSRDTPRKRAAAPAAGIASGANRCSTAVTGSSAEPQLEEVVDENFPVSRWRLVLLFLAHANIRLALKLVRQDQKQLLLFEQHRCGVWSSQQLVIQNAREKMLGDRSLQEKLAENINKILAR